MPVVLNRQQHNSGLAGRFEGALGGKMVVSLLEKHLK
jgi:hypothetical protein